MNMEGGCVEEGSGKGCLNRVPVGGGVHFLGTLRDRWRAPEMKHPSLRKLG